MYSKSSGKLPWLQKQDDPRFESRRADAFEFIIK
jgi:hypothetical protein